MLTGQDPMISVKSGTVGASAVQGNANIPDTIPIGATFTCTAAAPPSSGLFLNTVTWAGLGNLGSYLTGDSSGQPPQSMKTTAPVLNQPNTQFVVVQPNANYTIKATVTYKNAPGQWSSSVTFKSGAMPTYQYLGQVQQLGGQAVPSPAPNVTGDGNFIVYTNANNEGMGIEARTDPGFLGTYMLMQTDAVLRQFTDGSTVYQLANPAGGPQAFDNGAFGGATNTLGLGVYPTSNPGNGQPTGTSWTQNQISPVAQDYTAVFDPVPQNVPSQNGQPPAPVVPIQASVGGLNGGAQETLTTYLMYQPPAPYSGTWVAIGKVTWGYGGTANIQNGSFVQPILKPNTTPTVATPLNAATPTWTTRTSDIVAGGWQKTN
ncbi:MAG: hypothetical protein ACYC61_16705 [Isosphaeraceae bacterium]